ncbi:hypothetical protein ACQ4PT_036063 [Festuca glaucescens]
MVSWMDSNKPWVRLPVPVDDKVKALFEASVKIMLGDGEATQFWTHQWHPEGKLCTLFPDLFQLCTLQRITVQKAISQDKWIRHFKTDLMPAAIRQFTALWNLTRGVQLSPGTPDHLTWKWTIEGVYSVRSAYAAQFLGTIRPAFPPIVWRSDAPPKCRFYAWLAVQGRCLTTDVLAQRGCPNDPLCPFYRSEPETATHLLDTCPYTKEVRALVVNRARLPLSLIPDTHSELQDWLVSSSQQVGPASAKVWRSIIPLVWQSYFR